jgi:hypothetical protein
MTEINMKSGVVAGRRAISISDAFAETLVVAVFASALSMLHKGFVFGIENNVFHLPIVAGLYDEPQYHDDAFIQSLRHFSSGVWLLLNNYERHFGQSQSLFFVLAYLSRLLSFVGFLCCASLVGIVDRRDKIVFSLVLCFTSFLEGDSYAGTGGLFLNYFTHSEIANGTILLAIYFAAKGRFTAATIAAGVTFFINAFMACWLVPPLALIAVSLLARRRATIGAICSQTLVGLVPCLLLAMPVLSNIVGNSEFGKPLDFDFVNYLHQYFAGHVLIDSIPIKEILSLAAVTLLAAVALYWFGAAARELQAAYCGVILLYAIGIAVPFITSAPVVLNLHLLRSSTILHLLAALATAALATNWLRDDKAPTFLPGCLIVVLMSLGDLAFSLCIPIILSAYFTQVSNPSDTSSRRIPGYLVFAIALMIVWPWSILQNIRFNRLFAESVQEWTDVGNWVRTSTPPTAMFLVPSRPRISGMSEAAISDLMLSRTAIFEFVSHRRIWVDYKRGAAAMWTPSYYRTWRARLTEVEGLNSLDQRLAYARRNGIGYVIDRCNPALAPSDAIFRTERLCVFQAVAQDRDAVGGDRGRPEIVGARVPTNDTPTR